MSERYTTLMNPAGSYTQPTTGKRWEHRGVTIERKAFTGWYVASVYINKGSRFTSYYEPLMADTLGGMRALISETMNKHGLRAPSQLEY